MLKTKAPSLERLIQAVDLALAAGVCLVAANSTPLLRREEPSVLLGLMLAAALTFPVAMIGLGLYGSQRREPLLRVVARLLLAGAITASALIGLGFLIGRAHHAPVLAAISFGQTALFVAQRTAILGALRVARKRGRNTRDVAVLGTGPRARAFVEELEAHPGWGLRIAALLDEGDTAVDPALEGRRVHKLVDFPQLLRTCVIDEVVIALPRSVLFAVEPIASECALVGVPVTMLTGLFTDHLPAEQHTRFGRFGAVRYAKAIRSPWALALKRLLDVIGASLLLLMVSPVLAAAAFAIRRDSRGPILYRQMRLGLHGRPFLFFKFRSMVANAEELRGTLAGRNESRGPIFKMREDPRVTRVGRILRRWSIDELPQLWNVLRGEMSLVGPRPPLPEEVDCYDLADRRRLSVRPGLTCEWQVSGRSRIAFERWVELDLAYIDNWSLGLDLRILLRTPLAVLRRDGAY